MPTGKRMKRRKNIVDYESLDLQTGRLLRGYSFGFQSLSERIWKTRLLTMKDLEMRRNEMSVI